MRNVSPLWKFGTIGVERDGRGGLVHCEEIFDLTQATLGSGFVISHVFEDRKDDVGRERRRFNRTN